jgi:hypothetical protein
MDGDSSTDFSQEGRIMVGEIRDSEVIASNTNLEYMGQENPFTNPNSNEQSSNISRDQLQEFLNTVMQGIKAESAKQTAALQEESKKQTALLKAESAKSKAETAKLAAESAKLTSAVESLKSEIKKENERLANSLTAKFEAAHHKIREDFEAKLSSELITVSAKIDNVRKDNEGQISRLSSTIEEVYVSVTEKVDTAVTRTREEMAQYVDDKFRAISGDVQQVRKIADEVSKVQATLGELQNKVTSGSSNTPQSADSRNTFVRVISTDQQAASASGVGANILPSTNGARLGAHQQLLLLNYLVARMENTALYDSARTRNFSVAATEKLLTDAA